MQTVVISNQKQLEKFRQAGFKAEEFIVFCDNERFYEALTTQNIKFEKLDEFLLKDRWEEINVWGIREAGEWIKISRDQQFFKDYDYPSIVCMWLSISLIAALKNYLYANYILTHFNVTRVCVFAGEIDDQFPELSGNATLNYFLREVASLKQIEVCPIKLNQKKEPLFQSRSIKSEIKSLSKKMLQKVYGAFIKAHSQYDVMAFGTLRHLSSTMIELKSRGAKICFYDDEFRVNHFRFAAQNQIPYLIPSCFSKHSAGADRITPVLVKQILLDVLNHPECQNLFLYHAYDFKKFIKSQIFSKMENYLNRLAGEESMFRNILQTSRVSAALLDEDFNAHSFFAEFMKRVQVQLFCISHANMALDCIVDKSAQQFAQAHTFVHGEHEKDTYIQRGWVPDQVHVLGTPRYDRLIQMKNEKVTLPSHDLKILFSAAYFWPFSPDVLGYIGCDIYSFRYFQEQALCALFEACQDLPVTIVLKPHYAGDEGLWTRYIAQAQPPCKVEVVKASDDYFKLLIDSDAMVLCLWSSTLIEAGIAGVPVFYLDFENQNSWQVQHLEKSGLCTVIRNATTFRAAIQKIFTHSDRMNQKFKMAEQEYYLGLLDGQAGIRVSECILNSIKKQSHHVAV